MATTALTYEEARRLHPKRSKESDKPICTLSNGCICARYVANGSNSMTGTNVICFDGEIGKAIERTPQDVQQCLAHMNEVVTTTEKAPSG